MAQPKAFAVPVQVSAKQLARIRAAVRTPEGGRDDDVVETVTNDLIAKFSDGGMMLDPKTVARIDALTEGGVQFPQDLIPLVEKAIGQEDGCIVVKSRLDPSRVNVLTEIARAQGVSLQQLWQDTINFIMSQGWVYDRTAETPTAAFTQADMRRVREILGKDFVTGADILAALEPPEEEPAAEVNEPLLLQE